MSVFEAFRMSLHAIRSSPVRSFLMALGVIIGVATFITTLAIGNGSTQAVTSRVESLGTNLVTAFPAFGAGATFTVPLAAQLQKEAPDIANAMPVISGTGTIAAGTTSSETQVQGVSSAYLAMHGGGMAEGSFFTANDLARRSYDAVLGATVIPDLGLDTGLGQQVFINGYPFTVTGILQAVGSGSGPSNQDDVILIPYTTAELVLDSTTPSELQFQVKAPQDANLVVGTLEMIFNHLFPGSGGSSAVDVSSQTQLLNTLSSTTETLTVTLTAIAAVSLLVGGIGIMNIMLVSVTERTREIGLRKALGAKRGSILLQFLFEAALISMGGGLVGIAIGTWGAPLIGGWLKTTVVPTETGALLGFAFAATVGVVFGLWPAAQGSRLDPIVALRHD